MAYTFNDIIIHAFDLHTTVAPLLDETLFSPALRFLAQPETYQAAFQSGTAVNTANFRIKPLPLKEFREHYFWAAYGSIWRNLHQPDFWRLQVPFVGEIASSPLALDMDDPKIQATITPTTYLSAIGWSTNLEIRLTGDISSDSLRDCVRRLFHLKDKPFIVAGAPNTLTGVFGYFSNLIRSDVYTQQKPPLDKMTVEKRFVMAPAGFTGQLRYYCPPDKPDHPAPSWVSELSGDEKMSQSDCALMLSFLYGHPVTISDWFRWSYKEFLSTRLKGAGFALTDFERGTFLFMQDHALNDGSAKSKPSALWCYTSNVRYYAMMTAFLVRFHLLSQKDVTKSIIAKLRADFKTILSELPTTYPNAVCKNMHRSNDDIKTILAPSS